MSDLNAIAAATAGAQAGLARPAPIERLLANLVRGIRFGGVAIAFPSGYQVRFEGEHPGPRAVVEIRNTRLLFRVLASGYFGFVEGYLEGEWDTPDLTALQTFGMLNAEALAATYRPSFATTLFNRFHHARRGNTRRGARRNIAAHYDLGNAFFGAWLDETMTYSSALFADMAESHAEAQRRKYICLARALDLRPAERVLEIGCGWGGFAEIAAGEFGCEVIGITLSAEQAAYAKARMARAGLADRVEIRLQDYRDAAGAFDKIAAIEMFEAVGEKNWRSYFDAVANLLVPGGRAGLQVITISDDAFEYYRHNPDFIQRYIFPGGMLPSPAAFGRAVQDAGLKIADSFYFGKSYAETLRRWDKGFRENWPRLASLGFDERFFRMWRFYLTYCETGFDLERVNVGQFVIEHT
jgi:cyclopropane-fatty-acyl-phospholipid synthase